MLASARAAAYRRRVPRFLARILAALALLVTPARAHEELTANEAAARVVIEALAPVSFGDWAYRWDAVSARVSRHMHWHLPEPDPADAARFERAGWVSGVGGQVGVTAVGDRGGVRELAFEAYVFGPEALIAALRRQGVEVAVTLDTTDAGEYRLAPPGRDAALLRRELHCTPSEAARAQHCWHVFRLTLPVRSAAPAPE